MFELFPNLGKSDSKIVSVTADEALMVGTAVGEL